MSDDTIQRLLQGNESAWRILLDMLGPTMLAHIKQVVGDEDKAADLYNELLLDLIAGLRAIGSDHPPLPDKS